MTESIDKITKRIDELKEEKRAKDAELKKARRDLKAAQEQAEREAFAALGEAVAAAAKVTAIEDTRHLAEFIASEDIAADLAGAFWESMDPAPASDAAPDEAHDDDAEQHDSWDTKGVA